MWITRYAASAKRFLRICFILIKQLTVNLTHRVAILPLSKKRKQIDKYLRTRRRKVSEPGIARQTLEALGPSFIKLGQFLSVRPDLISEEFCDEFRKLQDNVPPFPCAEVRAELEKELERDPSEVFSEFDEIPVAAASVAQVHHARLRTGEEVAVKVQRPGIRAEIEADILIMLFFAVLLDKLMPSLRKNQLVMLVHEFSRWTDRELDFREEAKHALHFSYHLAGYQGIKIPQVSLNLTTERLLVMEFIHGVNILEAAPESFDKQIVAHRIAESMLRQIFLHGFFHADPHAGNIFLLERNTIAYVDFGIVGYLPQDLREATFDILYGMARGDIGRVIESFIEMADVNEEDISLAAYRREMNEVLSDLHVCAMANIPFTRMLGRCLNVSLEFGINVPHDFVVMSKAIATLEGTCLSLAPEINIVEYLQPFIEEFVAKAPDLDAALRQLKAGPFELGKLKRLLTKHGIRALRFLDRPTIRIEGGEFSRIVMELEKTSLNIVYGLLIAALIVFSATVRSESAFNHWLQTVFHLPIAPLLSLVSLAIAGYLWLRLILRNRPQKRRRYF
jgi:ubiquinone biosynthesis protein